VWKLLKETFEKGEEEKKTEIKKTVRRK